MLLRVAKLEASTTSQKPSFRSLQKGYSGCTRCRAGPNLSISSRSGPSISLNAIDLREVSAGGGGGPRG